MTAGETNPPADPLPPTVGPFRIEAEIGRGGMGVVYRGHSPDGARVAVKVLADSATASDAQARFRREAEIRIEHPNIVRVVDAGKDADGTSYIAFELLEGEGVETILGRRKLTPAEAVDLGVQVCRGLESAHRSGVIHRDLKPSNLFRCEDGTVKILDFGIALPSAGATRITVTGSVLGTPAFMSPEQLRGEPVDARSDVWSLGVVLYQALSGRLPFHRDTVLASMLAVVTEHPTPLLALVPSVPEALAAVIARAMSKSRNLRWGDAQELGAALAGADLTVTSHEGDITQTVPSMKPVSASLLRSGERRVVALLLADGVKDAAHIERLVLGAGGDFLPLVGDRAIGLFGADAWEGDEVMRAARAALGVRASADRVAIASGRASSAGAEISGAVLQAAERGCDAALDGVAADASSVRALGSAFGVRAVGQVWELTELPATAALSPDARFESPLLGRDAELMQAERALQSMLENGRAVVVLVTGAPGIGKTRLRRAMERELSSPRAMPADAPWRGVSTCGRDSVCVLSGRAEPLQRTRGLSLVAAAIRARCSELSPGAVLDESAQLSDRRAAVLKLAREAAGDPARAEALSSFLGELLGVAMPDVSELLAARSDPQLMADRLRQSVHDYFRGLTERGPVALVLEDLHWADEASLSVLTELLEFLSDSPFLVFVTARPELLEAKPQLFADVDLVSIKPRPLVASDVSSLSRSIALKTLSEPLLRKMIERTGGNPLFVEQIVLEIVDRGLLDAEPDELPMPLTVEAAVQSRLDRLPAGEKELCKRAAIYRRAFTLEEVGALGVTNADVLLRSLTRREVVSARARGNGDRQFQFRSSLVADVAYGLLPEDLCVDLHCMAARHLALRGDADDEELALHHERGHELNEAASRFAAAALAASIRGDTPRVLRCSDRALSLGAPTTAWFSLRLARADAFKFLGRRDEQAAELSLALESATSESERARVLAQLAMAQSMSGHKSEAIASATAAATSLAATHDVDPEVVVVVHANRALVHLYSNQTAEARAALELAMSSASGASKLSRALLASVRAQVGGAQGDIGERQAAFAEAAALFRDAGDERRAAGSESNLADALNRLGAYAEAESALRDAVVRCRRVPHRMMEGYALLNLGYSLALQGRDDEAVATIDEASEVARSTKQARLALWARTYRLRAVHGRPADAASEALSIVDEAQGSGAPAIAVTALSLSAQALLRGGDRDGALEHSGRAMQLLEELGAIEEDEIEVFVIRARVCDACDRREEADVVRQRARARLTEIAERIGDVTLRRNFLASVPVHRELLSSR